YEDQSLRNISVSHCTFFILSNHILPVNYSCENPTNPAAKRKSFTAAQKSMAAFGISPQTAMLFSSSNFVTAFPAFCWRL
ncbi:MAG: hypothetical protein K2O83_03295, partial [Schaedlerella arabinosiphila]|nr:hypothetical protein [Schaedlerella arabinosiphila]